MEHAVESHERTFSGTCAIVLLGGGKANYNMEIEAVESELARSVGYD
jgi:hypothetical protein